MKAYTDISQSKKLAEILPIESADMYWLNRHIDLTETKYEVFVIDKSNKHIDFFKSYAVAIDNNEIIPCWSLAALLEHLRKIDLFPDIIDSVDCVLMDISFADDEDGKVLHPIQCLRVEGKTILDTCYKMIVKLHEQNLL